MASRYRSRRRTRLKLKLAWCEGRAHSIWGASVPDLPGCIAAGATRREAETQIREVIGAHLGALREYRIAVPEPLDEIGEGEVTAA